MGVAELLLTSVGLAMDAFAVAICKGLSMGKMRWKHVLIVAAYFGIFQAGMPLFGYWLGSQFQEAITLLDHWISFALLSVIGLNMIRASRKRDCQADPSVDVRTMLLLALATSIDALAVGVTYAFLQVDIWLAIACIGSITFVMSLVGAKLGNVFGHKYKSAAEVVGGIILLAIGVKILLEHLGVLPW